MGLKKQKLLPGNPTQHYTTQVLTKKEKTTLNIS
jgi:hypothetical protein